MSEDAPIIQKRNPKIIPADSPSPGIDRGELRPPLRPEAPNTLGPREEAERYAAELMSRLDEIPDGDDAFDVKHLEPEGWTYAWHTYSLYNEVQNKNIQSSRQRGWRFVPRTRHPHLMPSDSTDEWIMEKGMVLVELPTVMVEKYHQARIADARNQIRAKEESLAGTPAGTLSRSEDPRTRPNIKKSFQAMPIPE